MSTRERILEACLPVFADRGFAGSTTRVLADAADVNVATLAWHFGGKAGLYEAVIDHMYEGLIAIELPEDLPDEREARIRLVVRTLWSWFRAHRDNVRLLQRHVLDRDALPESVSGRWTPQLLAKDQEVVQMLGLSDERDHRLALLDLNHLVSRYVLSNAADLVLFTDASDPMEAVARHLEDRAVQLLS
ncbi:MAG: TetR/AcrR family transcriptional regulator [Proteobacteria bacterium]|nr:TetR/AcrR family transcriptional regulator [Pseudomonadota bacterium]MCP4917732.1 TetR/AcrR family transcriptional regulator [Pseudomonadota bacterium]